MPRNSRRTCLSANDLFLSLRTAFQRVLGSACPARWALRAVYSRRGEEITRAYRAGAGLAQIGGCWGENWQTVRLRVSNELNAGVRQRVVIYARSGDRPACALASLKWIST